MDVELITEDRSSESSDPLIQKFSKEVPKIIIDKDLPDQYYDNDMVIDVPQRGFSTTSPGYPYSILGTSGLGPCTSLVLYDSISKTLAVTHVDIYAFMISNDIKREPEEIIKRLEIEAKIKDVPYTDTFSPIEYNFEKIINSMVKKGMNKNNNKLRAYILGGRTGISEHVIKNTYDILEKHNIPMVGINILGGKCGRSYLVDTNTNFYTFNFSKFKHKPYLDYLFYFFLLEYDPEKLTGGRNIDYNYKYKKYKTKYLQLKSLNN